MRRALIIAIIIHCSLLLSAGYVYVMRPEKKEDIFRAFLRAEKVAPLKKIKTAPPKKEMKKTPAVRPIRRERPMELIAVKKAVTSTFTVKLPEVSGAVYSPQVALVSVPEPTLAPERLPSFWEREIELKGRAIQLESFGVTTLKPLGSVENPVTRLVIQLVALNTTSSVVEIGIAYPEFRAIMSVAGGELGQVSGTPISIGPYAIRPEQFVFYAWSYPERGYTLNIFLSNGNLCEIRQMGPNIIQYGFADDPDGVGDDSRGDVVFIVTFMGAGGW